MQIGDRNMDKNIYEILIDNATNEYMDNILLHDSGYKKTQDKINKFTDQLDQSGLSEEQKQAVDQLVSSYTENSYCYGRIAYQQGFRDCALLLRKMKLIK